MEGSEYPLGQATASQDRLFDGVREREAFIEHVRQLAKPEEYEATRELFNEAYDDWMALSDLVNGELDERWMLNPAIPEDVKEDLGRRVGEVMNRPVGDLVARISGREKELADTEEQQREVERRRQQIWESNRKPA
jgi:hypothetical protein